MKLIISLVLLGIASSVHCQGKDSVALAIDNYLETVGFKFREECITETGVDRALVEKLEKAEMVNDDKIKCYIQCQGSKAKVVDDQGILNMDALKSVLKATNEDFLKKVESDCKVPKNPHLCEAAFEACLCVFDILYDQHHLH